MKKLIKDKAFTLIELLAVILILGIIALIAVPTVTNVIEDSKKGALKTTVRNLTQVAELQCEIERLNGKDITNIYTIEEGVLSSYLDIKNLPSSGTIIVDDECNVTVSVVDGNYCATLEEETVSINTNIFHCGGDYVDVPKTDTNCFEFNPNTRTITGYKFEEATCPTEISIPANINNVPVEHIGDFAFLNVEYDNIVYYAVSSNGNAFYDIVKENILKYPDFSIYSVAPVNYLVEKPTKNCYLVDGTKVVQDIDYAIPDEDVSKYTQCIISSTSINLVSNVGVITKVNFAPATNLKTIGIDAFMLNQITKVNFKDNTNLSSIGLDAFRKNLISGELDLSNSKLTSVGGFSGNSIKKVILPNTTTTLLDGAFLDNEIAEVIFGSNITTIGASAFSDNILSGNMVLPETITDIGYGSFRSNNIETLKINEKIKSISGGAFYSNSTLKSVTFGSNVENIGFAAFGYTAIESLEFNEKLKTIGMSAFNSTSLTSLTTPSSLEEIDDAAFTNSHIKTLNLNEGLKNIGEMAFYQNYITKIELPSTIENLGNGCFTANAVMDDSMFITQIRNGIKDDSILISVASRDKDPIEIPSTIKVIETYALYNAYTSSSIIVPDSVTTIKTKAFEAFNVRNGSIKIGSGIETIESNAFSCTLSWYCAYNLDIDKEKDTINGSPWGNPYMTITWKDS